jgi:hypothetical protein
MKFIPVLLFLLHLGMSQPIIEAKTADCFTYGAQYVGVSLNNPEQDRTPTAEDCQSFCQTVSDCVAFSWVDGGHDWEELRLQCTLWSETVYILVDKHYVSGPKQC